MSSGFQLLLIFLAWLAIATGCHFSCKRYYPASLLAAGLMVVIVHFAGYLETGKLDPLWYLTSVIGFLLGGILALIVGLPFRVMRHLRDSDDLENP